MQRRTFVKLSGALIAAPYTVWAGQIPKFITEILDDKTFPSIGNHDAPIKVIEFYDYNCPNCRGQSFKIKEFIEKHPKSNQVHFIMVDYPIISASSKTAALGSMLAHEKNQFANYHFTLFAKDTGFFDLSNDFIKKTLGETAGLSNDTIERGLKNESLHKQIAVNIEKTRALGIKGTPITQIIDNLGGYNQKASFKQISELAEKL